MTHARLAVPGLLLCVSALAQDTPRLSFEVASVKPSAPLAGDDGPPGMAGIRDRLQDNVFASRGLGVIPMVDKSRISLRRRTLASLVAAAWRVPAGQVSGPAWITELRFDIDAKLPEGAPASSVNAMLQNLLEDRFSVRFHRESREVPGYALVAAKGGPKLTPAAPPPAAAAEPVDQEEAKKKARAQMANMMANMKAGGGAGGSSSSWSDPSATMEKLTNHLSATLRAPVVDATAISGAYAISLTVQMAPDEDPASAYSQALSRYGLKLEPRKVSAEWLILESAAKEPKEN